MKQYKIKDKKMKHKSIRTLIIMGGLMDRLEQSKSLSNRKQERERERVGRVRRGRSRNNERGVHW